MNQARAKRTQSGFLPQGASDLFRKLAWQGAGLAVFTLGLALAALLGSFDPQDPSWNTAAASGRGGGVPARILRVEAAEQRGQRQAEGEDGQTRPLPGELAEQVAGALRQEPALGTFCARLIHWAAASIEVMRSRMASSSRSATPSSCTRATRT